VWTLPPILVFCDLDDTLFDSRTFSVDASARRALDRIQSEHVPLVFYSSRTRAELASVVDAYHEVGAWCRDLGGQVLRDLLPSSILVRS